MINDGNFVFSLGLPNGSGAVLKFSAVRKNGKLYVENSFPSTPKGVLK